MTVIILTQIMHAKSQRLLLILILLSCTLVSFSQKNTYTYLKDNRFNFFNSDSINTLYFLDSTAIKNRLIIVGEIHDIKWNDTLRLQLFKYLHGTAGYNILLEELSPAYVYLIQKKYFETGNDSILKYLHYTFEDKEYFRELYEYYSSLPDPDKFKIIGIDVDDNSSVTYAALYYTLSEISDTNVIKANVIKLLSNHNLPSNKKALMFARENINIITNNEQAYRQIFGENYDFIVNLLKGIIISTNKLLSKDWIYREKIMYDNIHSLLNKYPDQKCFGQFGISHVCKESNISKWAFDKNWTSFAAMLNNYNDSPVQGEVCSMIIHYPNFFTENIMSKRYYGVLDYSGRKIIEELSGKEICFYNICNVNSPYSDFCKSFDYIIVNPLWVDLKKK